jgi:class 3 adenylate cyclase
MAELPHGTVTFVFTDIEGSTRLLHELGAERYADALAEHRRVLREVFARCGGVEVDTQGDAFFYSFPTAPAALEAARERQEELDDGPVAVRMGVHTGTPIVTSEGYVGEDVHRAARIAACGHGGQVLVSAAVAAPYRRQEQCPTAIRTVSGGYRLPRSGIRSWWRLRSRRCSGRRAGSPSTSARSGCSACSTTSNTWSRPARHLARCSRPARSSTFS